MWGWSWEKKNTETRYKLKHKRILTYALTALKTADLDSAIGGGAGPESSDGGATWGCLASISCKTSGRVWPSHLKPESWGPYCIGPPGPLALPSWHYGIVERTMRSREAADFSRKEIDHLQLPLTTRWSSPQPAISLCRSSPVLEFCVTVGNVRLQD